jgi:hypothetical protein
LQHALIHAAAPCETTRVSVSGFGEDLLSTTKQMIAKSASNTNGLRRIANAAAHPNQVQPTFLSFKTSGAAPVFYKNDEPFSRHDPEREPHSN